VIGRKERFLCIGLVTSREKERGVTGRGRMDSFPRAKSLTSFSLIKAQKNQVLRIRNPPRVITIKNARRVMG